MQPGVYFVQHGEGKLFATLDDLIHGSTYDQDIIAHDFLNAIRDAAVEIQYEENTKAKLTIVIVSE